MVKLISKDGGKNDPLVSILILNYNGLKYVDKCLTSILQTNYSNFEIIFIDNASTDGSYEYVKKRYGDDPRLKIIRNKRNYGFAKGNNIGSSYAKGDYLVFLNVDTEVEPNWLRELVKLMESDPSIGAAQAKLLRMDEPRRLDTCGHKLTPYGFTYEVGLNEVANSYNNILEILAGKGAALMVRRKIFEEVGGFDEDYFLLREETDLCWRIWLRGYKVVFTPKAKVLHAIGGIFRESDVQSIYFFQRNMLITLIKNLEAENLLKILLLHLVLLFADSLFADLRSRKAYRLLTTMRCLNYTLGNLRRIWFKRLAVQSSRRIGDKELFKHVMARVSLMEKLRERARAGL
jgi:hypothetical protein